MTSNFERIAWALAILAFVPALAVMSGFVAAGAIAFGILTLYYGGRYGAEVWREQNVGAKSGRFDLNSTLNSRDDRDWGRK